MLVSWRASKIWEGGEGSSGNLSRDAGFLESVWGPTRPRPRSEPSTPRSEGCFLTLGSPKTQQAALGLAVSGFL